jgi:hypothetical protein
LGDHLDQLSDSHHFIIPRAGCAKRNLTDGCVTDSTLPTCMLGFVTPAIPNDRLSTR